MKKQSIWQYALTVPLMAGCINAFAEGAAEPEKKSLWEGTATVGLTLTSGNSDTILVTGNIKTQYKGKKNEAAFGLDGAYGKDNGDVNNETLHAFAQYNRLFTERFYGYARVDGLYDGIADIDYRFTLSPGLGYYLIKSTNTTLAVEAGPGYIWERKGGIDDEYVILRFAQRFEHKLNSHTRIWESVEYLPQVNDFNNYIINAEIGIEVSINKHMSMVTYAQDSYNSVPAAGRKSNDFKLVSGLKYIF